VHITVSSDSSTTSNTLFYALSSILRNFKQRQTNQRKSSDWNTKRDNSTKNKNFTCSVSIQQESIQSIFFLSARGDIHQHIIKTTERHCRIPEQIATQSITMRFFEVSATAIAATTMLSGAFAAVAPPSYESESSAAAPPAYTSATTTYYTTRTVMRVVETMTATRNGTTSTFATTESSTSTVVASASATLYPYTNGTAAITVAATAALPSASSIYVTPPPSLGSASQLSVGLVALLGFAGLLL
jgi:hypothetical protein